MVSHILISEEKSIFIPRRLFTDNVLAAYECVHAIRTRKRTNIFVRGEVGHDEVVWPGRVDFLGTHVALVWVFLSMDNH